MEIPPERLPFTGELGESHRGYRRGLPEWVEKQFGPLVKCFFHFFSGFVGVEKFRYLSFLFLSAEEDPSYAGKHRLRHISLTESAFFKKIQLFWFRGDAPAGSLEKY